VGAVRKKKDYHLECYAQFVANLRDESLERFKQRGDVQDLGKAAGYRTALHALHSFSNGMYGQPYGGQPPLFKEGT
jgi:hypothetical protein